MGHAYNVIVGRHLKVTSSIEEYVEKKLGKLERISDKIVDIHVAIDHQRSGFTVAMVLHVGHYTERVVGLADDVYAAIDRAVDKLKSLIIKHKEKISNHHHTPHAEVNMVVGLHDKRPSETDLVNDAIEEASALEEEGVFIAARL